MITGRDLGRAYRLTHARPHETARMGVAAMKVVGTRLKKAA
ncbi:MAG TPA: hypothetical protein VGX03_30585 [Candidatus Binatia bacterium]|nr:hypothetical protein [Candidatus Binatia bacterium]